VAEFKNPLADLVETQICTYIQRAPFEELCAYYGALRSGVRNEVVARASNLSRPAVAQLRAAGRPRGGQLRYPKVAREYVALGHQAFVAKYVNAKIRDRLEVALKEWIADPKRISDQKPVRGVNPRAKAYAGRHEWPETSIGLHAIFMIEWDDDANAPRRKPGERIQATPGWKWRNLKPRQDLPEIPRDQAPLLGDPAREDRGFATSEDCFRWVRSDLNPKD
jgi:hypothetical protein